ncbi:MAG TPA: hypothetical protein VNE39_02155 [Planctomycetota bacterium]|nr:hypothetical protein [Planctomycetota bacterium]
MRTRTLAAVVAMAVAAVASAAVPRPPRGKAREARQRDRIRDGIRDHSLTPAETARLRQEQLRIHEMARDFASDGVVTPAERLKLEAAQDAASRRIAKESNDLQGAGGPAPAWKVWDPGVNRRQWSQHLRIAQGIASGALTAEEAGELISMEAKIRQMERAMKSDGVLTVAERKGLHAALNAASEAIFAVKHDEEHRLRPAIVRLVDSDALTRAEARQLYAQAARLLEIVRLLGGPGLSPERRLALEQEFAALASQLFD